MDQQTDRRDEIMVAAVQVFSRLGPGAPMRLIAEAAGIKKGLLTYYFPTKEDLVYALARRMQSRIVSEMDAWLESGPSEPADRLRGWLERHALIVCESADEYRTYLECQRLLSPPRAREVLEVRHAYFAEVARLIDDCRPLGWVAPEETHVLARASLAIVSWIYVWYRPDGPLSAHEISSRMADRAMASLGATPGAP